MKTFTQFVTEDTSGGLYAYRNLTSQSAEYLYLWMREEGIPNPVPPGNLHVTVVCTVNDVPGYSPDPTLVMLSPATYRIDQMQEALVIKFRSDALESQWQQAMNLGAKSYYERFIPHITLSYKVPEDYDHSDLKPPPSHIVLDAEQIRPRMDGWATMNGLREFTGDVISDTPGVYVPQNNLNIPREHMPQISDQHKMKFIDWLENQGIIVQFLDMPVAILRSVQHDIDLKKVEKMMDSQINKPIITSNDNYVIDGHHRWIARLNRDPHQVIPTYRINLPVQQCIQCINSWRENL